MNMTEEEIKAMQEKLEKMERENKDLRAENAKRRTTNKTAEEKLAELESEKERLQREKEQSDLEAKGKYEEAAAKIRETLLTEKQKEAERANNFEKLYRTTVIDKGLIEASSDTVSPRQALLLAKDKFNFELDDKGGVVIKEGDSIALNKDGAPLDFKGVVETIKSENPNLVPSNGGGSGSTGGAGGGMDSDALAMKELATLAGLS